MTIAFFIGQKNPQSNKNFFQNYHDHLKHLADKAGEEFSTKENKMEDISLKRLNMFDPLIDGYDYFDEVLGATLVPIVGTAVAIGYLLLSIKELMHGFAIKMTWVENDHQDHSASAETFWGLGLFAGFVALASLLKSAISLISRPIITLARGWKSSEETRFHNDDSVLGNLNNEFESLYTNIYARFTN